MRRAIAGRQRSGSCADNAQRSDGQITDAFRRMDRELIDGKLSSGAQTLNYSDGTLVARPPGNGAAYGSENGLGVINRNREAGGCLPGHGFVDQRKAQDARHVSIHDATYEFDDGLQCGCELWPGIGRSCFSVNSHELRSTVAGVARE
jgi:hypothetical protein